MLSSVVRDLARRALMCLEGPPHRRMMHISDQYKLKSGAGAERAADP